MRPIIFAATLAALQIAIVSGAMAQAEPVHAPDNMRAPTLPSPDTLVAPTAEPTDGDIGDADDVRPTPQRSPWGPIRPQLDRQRTPIDNGMEVRVTSTDPAVAERLRQDGAPPFANRGLGDQPWMQEVNVEVELLDDGILIRMTSEDPQIVRRLQQGPGRAGDGSRAHDGRGRDAHDGDAEGRGTHRGQGQGNGHRGNDSDDEQRGRGQNAGDDDQAQGNRGRGRGQGRQGRDDHDGRQEGRGHGRVRVDSDSSLH